MLLYDDTLLSDLEKVVKDRLKGSKQWAGEAGLKGSGAKCHILPTTNSNRRDNFDVEGKEINITTSAIYFGFKATNKGVSDKQSIGRIENGKAKVRQISQLEITQVKLRLGMMIRPCRHLPCNWEAMVIHITQHTEQLR